MLRLSNLFQMTLCKLFQSLPHTLLSEIDEDAILVVAQPWMWADSNLQPKSTNEHLRLHASSTNIAWARREQERERRNKKTEKSVNIHVFMLTGFPAVLPWKKICQPPFKWKKATLTHTKKNTVHAPLPVSTSLTNDPFLCLPGLGPSRAHRFLILSQDPSLSTGEGCRVWEMLYKF